MPDAGLRSCQNGGAEAGSGGAEYKGRSGAVCLDPGVMQGTGAGSCGAIALPPRDVGHLLQLCSLCGGAGERGRGMYPRQSQRWVLQA